MYYIGHPGYYVLVIGNSLYLDSHGNRFYHCGNQKKSVLNGTLYFFATKTGILMEYKIKKRKEIENMKEKKRRILFVIPVSEEAYRRWQIKKECIKQDAPEFFKGMAIGAIVYSYFGTIVNSVKIERAERRLEKHSHAINQHADVINNQADKIEELQRQNNLLLEKALRQTEGKEDPAA